MAGMARAPESRGMAALHSMESAVSRQANALAHGVHEMEARVAHGVHDLEAKVEAKVSAAVHKLDAKASYRYRLRQEREKEEAAQPKDLRMRISDVVRSNAFEMLMGVVVMVNFLLICYQVNDEAECYPPPDPFATPEECKDMKSESLVAWLIFLFVFIYTFELACRLYVERCAFFNSGWNNLDAVVVVSGLSSELLSESDAISALRILRTVRLFRVFRVLVAFRELYVIFLSMVSTVRSLICASIMLFALLTLWSLILVEYVHPVATSIDFEGLYGCSRCSQAFSSILRSNLTMFQTLVAGDSWGQINVPMIEAHPWTAFLLIGACITVSLGLMNLILAVIVQRAADARNGDAALKAEEHESAHEDRKRALMEFCARMDVDCSGHIVLQELHDGYRNNEEFRLLLTSMDIKEEELTTVFRVLDLDCSGEVSYTEFVEELIKIQTRDIRTVMMFMKVNVTDCLREIRELHKRIDEQERQRAAPDAAAPDAGRDGAIAPVSPSDDQVGKPAGVLQRQRTRGLAMLHSMESAVSRQAQALAHGVHGIEAKVAHGVHDLAASSRRPAAPDEASSTEERPPLSGFADQKALAEVLSQHSTKLDALARMEDQLSTLVAALTRESKWSVVERVEESKWVASACEVQVGGGPSWKAARPPPPPPAPAMPRQDVDVKGVFQFTDDNTVLDSPAKRGRRPPTSAPMSRQTTAGFDQEHSLHSLRSLQPSPMGGAESPKEERAGGD